MHQEGDSPRYLGDVIASVNGNLPSRHCRAEQELLCSCLGFPCKLSLHFLLGERQVSDSKP